MKIVKKSGGIVISDMGEILLVTSSKGLVTLPKGGLEADETYREAALREIKEESGLKNVKIIRELGTIIRPGYTHENLDHPTVEKHIKIFLCRTDEHYLQPVDKSVLKAEWVSIKNALEILSWPEEKLFLSQQLAKLVIK